MLEFLSLGKGFGKLWKTVVSIHNDIHFTHHPTFNQGGS